MKNLSILILTSLLVACVSSNVTVRVPSQQSLSPVQGVEGITVDVIDLRKPGVAASTREAAFGVPMGNVTFDPPEKQLVKDALEVALAKQSKATGPYTCEILEFGVNTNTTPLYWDVIGVVRLNLKKDGREHVLSGTHTERTYLWPGETILGRVTQESLGKAVDELSSITK